MTRIRVLVVDDKKNFRALFERVAPSWLDVVCACDGREALDLLERERERVDVLLTDVRMPRVDGLELLDAVRQRHASVAVIVMTAFGNVRDAVRAIKSGASEYLTKPFDPDDAIAAIANAVRPRPDAIPPYREALQAHRGDATRHYLEVLLRDAHGNVTRAAQRAGIERESLHRLMRRHGVVAHTFRK